MKNQSKISSTMKQSFDPSHRVTRSHAAGHKVSQFTMEEEILEFCLDEVIKIEYNFATLEKHVLLSAKKKNFICFEHLPEKDVIDFITLFFENNDFLNEIQIKMMCDFPIFTQDVICTKVVSKNKVKKPTKAQIDKVNTEAVSTKTLRRIHLYELKKNISEVRSGECYFLNDCLLRKVFYMVQEALIVRIALFLFIKNVPIMQSWKKIDVYFVLLNVRLVKKEHTTKMVTS